MNIATYCKVFFGIICVLFVWTFFIEENITNYYRVYFSNDLEELNKTNVINNTYIITKTIEITVPCPEQEDGPFLAQNDDINLKRARKVEILSYNNTNLTLEYSDVTWQVCIMMKNQAPDLAEWIEMQYLLGATHISIYDHGSTDNITEILKVYMNESNRRADPYFPQIELIRWPPREHTEDVLSKRRQYLSDSEHEDVIKKIAICKEGIGLNQVHASGKCQQAMIADCVGRFRFQRDWLSWHDVDEFFWVYHDEKTKVIPTLSSYLPTIRPETVSVYVNAITFGTSGFQNRSQYELVVESHLLRAPYTDLGEKEKEIKDSLPDCKRSATAYGICDKGGGKSLNRGKTTKWQTTLLGSPHYMDGGLAEITVPNYPVRMNHYQMKSLKEADESSRKQNKDWSYQAALYAGGFWNAIFDSGLAKFSPEIRKRLKMRGLL